MQTLEEGRELDERMHELLGYRHLVGVDVPEPAHHLSDGVTVTRQEVWMREGHWQCVHCGNGPEPYSTDIAGAWQVVEEFAFANVQRFEGQYSAVLRADVTDTSQEGWGWAETAPLAICRAALAAVSARAECSAAP